MIGGVDRLQPRGGPERHEVSATNRTSGIIGAAPSTGSTVATIALAVVLAWCATPAMAEDSKPRLDAQRFDPAPQGTGFARVREAQQLYDKQWALGLSLNYARRPLRLGGSETTDELGGVMNYLIGTDLWGAVALGDHVQFGVVLPLLQTQNGADDVAASEAYGLAGGGDGFGDIRVTAGVQLLRQDAAPVSLAVAPTFVLPTGSREMLVGSGALGLGLDAAVGRRWQHFRFDVNVGFLVLTHSDPLIDVMADDELHWAVAAGVPLGFGGRIEAFLEYLGATVISPRLEDELGLKPFAPRHTPMEVDVGARFDPMGPFAFVVGGGPGLGGGFGTPDVRIFAGVILQPDERRDRDGDGIPDLVDQCKLEPEDLDEFRDKDGCPDIDNDGDGILDANDQCPGDPEIVNGVLDDDGCPEVDTDGDGILDPRDACPEEPEDMDGFQDDNGCPELDNDGDGILDADDRCPDQPETINEFEDEDGCPDRRPIAVLAAKEIQIEEKVYFDTDSANIQSRSFAVLDDVAAVMAAHPEVLRLEVQGHTDAFGPSDHNKKLSQQRAEAVRDYLVRKGVETERLVPVGYGEEQLIDKRFEEEAHAANRRVQFIVLEMEQEAGERSGDPGEPEGE